MTTKITSLALLSLCAQALPLFAGDPGKAPVNTPVQPADTNPLSFDDGRLVIDFDQRFRFEYRENNFDFNKDKRALTDGTWLEDRTRIGILFKPEEWLKFYIQGQDSREIDSPRPKIPGALGAEGDDPADLHQLWFDIGDDNKGLSLKVGRQILSYGDERLLGAFDWNNLSRVWDAAKLHYAADTWWVDAFAGSVVNPINYKFDRSDLLNNAGLGHDQMLSGIYFSTTALDFQVTDLYALYLHQNFTPSDTDFVTLGTRWKSTPGKLGPWDYDAEFAAQTGTLKGKDLATFAGHAEVGYTLDAPWMPRMGIDYAYASGDSNPADGKVTTFQNLYPTNHLFYSYMDLFAWQNLHDLDFNFKVKPCDTVSFRVDYRMYWLADTADAWYRANGTTMVRPITPSASDFAGSEVDLTLTYTPKKWLSFQLGYSHFFAGNYLKDTGAHSDADFAYSQVTIKF